jgi:hypothetical protein
MSISSIAQPTYGSMPSIAVSCPTWHQPRTRRESVSRKVSGAGSADLPCLVLGRALRNHRAFGLSIGRTTWPHFSNNFFRVSAVRVSWTA